MKRIVTLVVAGLIASSSMLAAQDRGVGFERAATAAERESEGVALKADLLEVLGEAIYVITTSAGERVLVNAGTGRVENVEAGTDEFTGRGSGGPSAGRGVMGSLGALLAAADAEIDFDRLIATASREADREDVRSIGIRIDGGVVVAHVAFGDHGRFALSADDAADPIMVIVDVENDEALDTVEAGSFGSSRRFADRGPGRGFSGQDGVWGGMRGGPGGFSGGGRR